MLDPEVVHREVVGVVGEQDRSVRSRRSGNEGVGRVDRPAPPGPLGLVASGPACGLTVGYEEPEPVQKSGRSLPLSPEQAPFHLGEIDTRGRQRVSVGDESPELGLDLRATPQPFNEDRAIDQVRRQRPAPLAARPAPTP